MKFRPFIQSAIVAFGFTPFLAHAGPGESVQRCMDEFAAQNFPNSRVSFVIEDAHQGPMPLVMQTGTQWVRLVATAPTGRVLAKTTCEIRTGATREGQVIVMPPRDNNLAD